MLIIVVLVLETLKLVLTILALLFELCGIAFNTQEMVAWFPDEKPTRPLITAVFTRRISMRTLKRDLRDHDREALIQLELCLTVSLPLSQECRNVWWPLWKSVPFFSALCFVLSVVCVTTTCNERH